MGGGGGDTTDTYQMLNISRAAPNRKTFIFKTPHLHLENLRTPLQHLIRYTFWCKIGNGTSTGVRHCVAQIIKGPVFKMVVIYYGELYIRNKLYGNYDYRN
jgi:hypothetical protein